MPVNNRQDMLDFDITRSSANYSEQSSYIDKRTSDMETVLNSFIVNTLCKSEEFNAKSAFSELFSYIKEYQRLYYSRVSNTVYSILEKDDKAASNKSVVVFDTLLTNVAKLLAYADDTQQIEKDWLNTATEVGVDYKNVQTTQRAVWKLWDHIQLARRQYDVLKISNSEYDEKFKARISGFQSEITGQMNSQMISLIAIFTALAFVLFGGISSLSNVLSKLEDTHVLLLLIIGCGWGLGMMNVTFVFLYLVGKLTGLRMEATTETDASFSRKYPIVVWTDYILCALMVFMLWIYFCVNRGAVSLLDGLFFKFPVWTPVGSWIYCDYNHIDYCCKISNGREQ